MVLNESANESGHVHKGHNKMTVNFGQWPAWTFIHHMGSKTFRF